MAASHQKVAASKKYDAPPGGRRFDPAQAWRLDVKMPWRIAAATASVKRALA
ncbi:MAG: hypothetical protein ABIT83_21290 [Massilia sp.]